MTGSVKEPGQIHPFLKKVNEQFRRKVIREVYDHRWVNLSTRETAAFIALYWPEVVWGKPSEVRTMPMPKSVHWAAYLMGWIGDQVDHDNEPEVDKWLDVDWPTIGWFYHRQMAIVSDNEDMIEPEPNVQAEPIASRTEHAENQCHHDEGHQCDLAGSAGTLNPR